MDKTERRKILMRVGNVDCLSKKMKKIRHIPHIAITSLPRTVAQTIPRTFSTKEYQREKLEKLTDKVQNCGMDCVETA